MVPTVLYTTPTASSLPVRDSLVILCPTLVVVFGFQLQCCGITGYNDYNVDIWNTNPAIWHGRNPAVLAPLTCCVQHDNNAFPPTVDNLSPSCLYNGTVASDYYQPVDTYCELSILNSRLKK